MRRPAQLAQHPGQRVVAAELDVAVGADDQQARGADLAGHVLEQQQRGLVGPVQVVEEQDHRAVARGRDQEARDRVEQPEARLLALGGPGRLDVEALGDLGHELGDLGGAGAHLPRHRHRVGVAHVAADRLHPGPVGGRALVLAAAAPVDAGAADLGVGGELLRGARLADPRLADQQQQPAAARERARRRPRAAARSRARARRRRRRRAGRAGCRPAPRPRPRRAPRPARPARDSRTAAAPVGPVLAALGQQAQHHPVERLGARRARGAREAPGRRAGAGR